MDINAKLKAAAADDASQYDASTGRKNWGLFDYRHRPMLMYVQRVRLTAEGCDPGGVYWGDGTPLFCGWAADLSARVFVRAKDRALAKRAVKEHFINAKFFR